MKECFILFHFKEVKSFIYNTSEWKFFVHGRWKVLSLWNLLWNGSSRFRATHL